MSHSTDPPEGGDAVRFDVTSAVATLTMDQPHNRNALTPALLNGLGDSLARADAEPSVRVVVLTHTGPAFCAGADLSDSGRRADTPRYSLAQVLMALQHSSKPVVARIAGHCLGGGVGVAAGCDISIAAQGAMLGFTEVRLGLAPAVVSVVCLPKLRRADALELFLTGKRVEAQEAAEMGLINRAVPFADLDAEVEAVLTQLLAAAPAALAAAKRLIVDALPERAEAYERSNALSLALLASDEAKEGMAAFRERRNPSWVPTSYGHTLRGNSRNG
jgi:methylglutaconyl-CoA hydratase